MMAVEPTSTTDRVTMTRLKILVSAYACSPKGGSEPGMAWGWINQLAKKHDLWILTEKDKFQKPLEEALSKRPELAAAVKFHFIPKQRWKRLRKVWPPSYYWFYHAWQKRAYAKAVELQREVNFDLVHQLNMIGYREPGYLWRLEGVPFVWGPVGGTADVPLRFAPILGPRESFFHFARNTINHFQLRHHKRVDAAVRRADGFVTANTDERIKFQRVKGKDSAVISATGVVIPEAAIGQARTTGPLKLVFAGLHYSRKGLELVIRALPMLSKDVKVHLDVLGQGVMSKRWRGIADKLGVSHLCTWHGWLPKHDDAMRIMDEADVLVFPSLQEGSPTVVLEAMARSLPVICLDHYGMAEFVTPDSGIKLPVTHPSDVSQRFASAIEQLARDPELVANLSRGARARAQEYSWAKQADLMFDEYQRAIDGFSAVGQSGTYPSASKRPASKRPASKRPAASP